MLNEITFELMEHVGVLESKADGWTKEVNVVSWNGGEPKIDIRDWDPHHERMTRGITLFEDVAEKLANALAEYYKDPMDLSSFKPAEPESEEVTFEIAKHIGVLDAYENSESPWTKEVNLVSWNCGPVKIDIRDWSADHQRMSRGITLDIALGEKLGNLLSERSSRKAEEALTSTEGASIDKVFDDVLDFFENASTGYEFERDKKGAIIVDEVNSNNVMGFKVLLNGTPFRISVEEAEYAG